MFIRNAYNYDVDQASDDSGLSCGEESLTHQSFAEECDINTIVRRFGITGEMPEGLTAPHFRDYEGIVDFQTAMNAVVAGREVFDELPAEVRARFGNDPQSFLEFCSDDVNRAAAEKMGLAIPRAVEAAPAPIKVEVVVPSSGTVVT